MLSSGLLMLPFERQRFRKTRSMVSSEMRVWTSDFSEECTPASVSLASEEVEEFSLSQVEE